MAAVLLLPTARATDHNGKPYAGAKWFFYESDSLTPLGVYADADLNVSLGSVVTADSGGKFPAIYFDGSKLYRGVCTNFDGSVTLHDIDPINPFLSATEIVTDSGKTVQEVLDSYLLAFNYHTALVDGLVPGSVSASQATVNGNLLQGLIDECSLAGGGTISVDFIYEHDNTLQMKSGVHLTGKGKASSGLRYTGATLQIDAVGSASDRILFSINNMTLSHKAGPLGNTAGCMELGWNQRSLPITTGLKIQSFGDFAQLYSDYNWLIVNVDLEIDSCAKNVPALTTSAIRRLPTGFELADIKYVRPVIEDCGHSLSEAGAINFVGTSSTSTQGFWIEGGTIEGNSGNYECRWVYADTVSINGTYFETAGTNKRCLGFSNAYGSVTNSRIASGASNTNGIAVHLSSESRVNFSGNTYDSDFLLADIFLDNSIATGVDYTGLARVVRSGTGSWLTPTVLCSGAFTGGATPVVMPDSINIDSVVRNSGGNYSLTFSRPLPSTAYSIQVTARSASTGILLAAPNHSARAVTGFTIYTGTAPATLLDADEVSVAVFAAPY